MEEKKSKSQPITKRMVWEAYKAVRKGGKAAGVDRMSMEAFEADRDNQLYKLWNRLSSGSYFPPAVREVSIPKPGKGERKLGIPTVGDRIAQMVVKHHLEERFEAIFDDDSYGYRHGKSQHDALSQARKRCFVYSWAIDLDIAGFFDELDHTLLRKALCRHVSEKWILMYLDRWLAAPIEKSDGVRCKRERGTPQGGVISPLLANLYLHYCFDAWMGKYHSTTPFERYADDIVIHCVSEQEATEVLEAVRQRMTDCHLRLHPEKTKIVYCKQNRRRGDYPDVKFTFLGYDFQPRRCQSKEGHFFTGFTPAIGKAKRKKLFSELRQMGIQNRTRAELGDLAADLNPKLSGWINYYGKYRRSSLWPVMEMVNDRLTKWACRKYKRFKGSPERARKWLEGVSRREPKLFAHWAAGFKP